MSAPFQFTPQAIADIDGIHGPASGGRRPARKAGIERSSGRAGLIERTRSLPNRNYDLRYEHLIVQAARDLGRVGHLEEKRQRFHQIGASLAACFVQTSS
jgi:hypothetical protein